MNGPPIPNGWVDVVDGRIAATGHGRRSGTLDGSEHDLGHVALLPALVNAHAHLELSFLRGRVPPSATFSAWVRTLLRMRGPAADADPSAVEREAANAIAEARASGTGVVGDVANTRVTVPLLVRSALSARVFIELLGFNVQDPAERVRAARAALVHEGLRGDRLLSGQLLSGQLLTNGVSVGLAPHAPYSVSPALFAALGADVHQHSDGRSTVHLGESPEEVEFLRTGTGPFRMLLDDLGAWNPGWRPPGCSPARYLESLGWLGPRVAVVHGVQLVADDLDALRAHDSAVIVCPRSNEHVGVGVPPLQAFYDAGLRVAVGTDSLASVADLNLFSELARMRRAAPSVRARQLLQSATAVGADVLGLEADHGTIQPGRRADLIAVTLPPHVRDAEDVEEYLLTGIAPDQVSWIDATWTSGAPERSPQDA